MLPRGRVIVLCCDPTHGEMNLLLVRRKRRRRHLRAWSISWCRSQAPSIEPAERQRRTAHLKQHRGPLHPRQDCFHLLHCSGLPVLRLGLDTWDLEHRHRPSRRILDRTG